MRHHLRVILGAAAIGVMLTGVVCLSGCKKSEEPPSQQLPEPYLGTHDTDIKFPAPNGSNSPSGQNSPAKLEMPTVKLTESLNKTCLVKVGDKMPDGTLTDLNGQPVSLYSAFGQNKLTVVCFWKANFPLSLEEVGQLQTYIAGPYAAKGVKVIAINEDDPPNVAGAAFQKEKAAYPCLLDPRGNYFSLVATQELPRTYLVDSEGNILWFDIKYSSLSTRRALEQAIQFVLKEGAEPNGE